MKVVVPDASVLLKWVLQSDRKEDNDRALSIRAAALDGRIVLRVPTLWIYEVGNTLSRRFPKQAPQLLQAFMSFGLEEANWTKPWLQKCLHLTNAYRVTFYDAAYHSLALVSHGTFVTADEDYVLQTRGAGSIKALSAWTML